MEGLQEEACLRSFRLPIQGGLEWFSASGNRFLAASSMMTARCGQNASASMSGEPHSMLALQHR